MGLKSADLLGTGQIGVHLAVAGSVLFAPMQLSKKEVSALESTLGLEVAKISIGGSALVGALIAGNSNGIAVADIATSEDIDRLTSYGDVIVMESGVNAAGNLLVINENGIIASPVLPQEGLDVLSETLRVECSAINIAGNDTPGSVAVCNNKGVLVHPDITEHDVEKIESILGVPAMVGTVNFGSPYVGSGCVATDEGAWAGSQTTGPELNRIEDALGLI
ncbi:MAG: translation initiation factor IF-6 [Candidatus Thermoplasmatota archaeon]|nr:translation initiation factor IF-6 [Euryarchaeota archaeon]MEC9090833.1 translation initiation factor IF-6 [Candidatus Thermoplasmatota archaeon]MED5486724.1 translation initiation factor IF-6 [Candidatus Thermoplasmatota archaeon]|tara:strand:+ start:112 stop:774 length:663 start_codon:yes stop_codon:yes gene_type:complete